MTEPAIWKPVVGYKNYYHVNIYGQIKSVGKRKGCRVGRILRPGKNPNTGYWTVVLKVDGINTTRTVHSLVLGAFRGLAPKDGQYWTANHKSGDKDNNTLANLEWVTHSENNKHAYAVLNRQATGGLPVLMDDEVSLLKRLYKRGNVTQKRLAVWFRTPLSTIAGILGGRRRANVT